MCEHVCLSVCVCVCVCERAYVTVCVRVRAYFRMCVCECVCRESMCVSYVVIISLNSITISFFVMQPQYVCCEPLTEHLIVIILRLCTGTVTLVGGNLYFRVLNSK